MQLKLKHLKDRGLKNESFKRFEHWLKNNFSCLWNDPQLRAQYCVCQNTKSRDISKILASKDENYKQNMFKQNIL